jgi:para-aminobenzoate synthetase/4-amino-4-deoxychorismate lyase
MSLPVMIATGQTHSSNRFLYHKTTNRVEYDAAYQSARNAGFCEVLFTNEHGELTEGSRSNIFVQIDGTLFTPPVECGLLNGVMRQYLLRESATDVAERILTHKDLLRADRLFIANSVRGLTEVQLLPVTDRLDASSSVSMALSSKEVGHAAYD